MNFTKQDLQKISAYLGRQSVKDSQFSKVQSLKSDTGIPVLQSGENKMATIEQLMSYLYENLSLKDIPVTIVGIDSMYNNLYDVLDWLYRNRGTGGGGNGGGTTGISVDQISCNYTINGIVETKLNHVIYYILSVLSGISTFPTSATEQDINNIFK